MEMDSLARDVQNMLNIPDDMEKMLQRPARAYVKQTKAFFRTNADILERPDCYQFILDMPGLEPVHIKVKVENNVLHVAGKKKKIKKPDTDVKVLRMERRRARYMRKFSLPVDANADDITASYKDGVLTVTVGKRPVEETQKPVTVTIPIS